MKMRMIIGGSCALLLALTTHGHALKASSSCESLSSLALPNTSITLAQVVPTGAFTRAFLVTKLEWSNLDEWPKTSRKWPTSSSATALSPPSAPTSPNSCHR